MPRGVRAAFAVPPAAREDPQDARRGERDERDDPGGASRPRVRCSSTEAPRQVETRVRPLEQLGAPPRDRAEPMRTASRPSRSKSRADRREPCFVLELALCNLPTAKPDAPDIACVSVGKGDENTGDLRKALLPDRVLDDHRDDVPPRSDGWPRSRGDGRDEIGDDEHEAPDRDAGASRREELERLRQGILGRIERRVKLVGEALAETARPDIGLARAGRPVGLPRVVNRGTRRASAGSPHSRPADPRLPGRHRACGARAARMDRATSPVSDRPR